MSVFCEFVENKIAKTDDSFLAYAGASFLKSCKAHKFDEISDEALQTWVIDMILAELKKSTRKKYFGKVYSLYKEWDGYTAGVNPFEQSKVLLEYDGECNHAPENLSLIPRLLKRCESAADDEVGFAFLYLLYNVEASLSEVINLKFGSQTVDVSQIEDIVETMRKSSRKKYVFGLEQGKKRETQISRELLHDLWSTANLLGFDFGNCFSRESITSIWIAAAMKAGIPIAEICGLVKQIPTEYSYLKTVSRVSLTANRKRTVLQKVADSINDNTRQWFIMKLRSGKTPDDIKEAIAENFAEMVSDTIFYHPTHQVVRYDKKNKKIREEVPYLPGILFFKTRRDKVGALFSRIGDLAWCYKMSNTPDSPYCTIPIGEMKKFQKYIGQFTPDIKMELVSRDDALALGTTVRINGGGMMEGRIGIIQSVKKANGTRTYTLILSDRDVAMWTVKDIDEVYIEPAIN